MCIEYRVESKEYRVQRTVKILDTDYRNILRIQNTVRVYKINCTEYNVKSTKYNVYIEWKVCRNGRYRSIQQ